MFYDPKLLITAAKFFSGQVLSRGLPTYISRLRIPGIQVYQVQVKRLETNFIFLFHGYENIYIVNSLFNITFLLFQNSYIRKYETKRGFSDFSSLKNPEQSFPFLVCQSFGVIFEIEKYQVFCQLHMCGTIFFSHFDVRMPFGLGSRFLRLISQAFY